MSETGASVARILFGTAGAILAGPGGALIGNLAGGLLATSLPGFSNVIGELLGKVTTHAIEKSSAAMANRLAQAEARRINHDLQTAFRDSFAEALYDLGGERCFPEAWRARRDVPAGMVFPLTPQANRLWQAGDPLAAQACEFFQELHQALAQGRLLPLDPPADQPAASVRAFIEADSPQVLNQAFFQSVIAPYLAARPSLFVELPELEQHLRRHLLDRTLVYLGEALKHRAPAWRAFNRMLLEEIRAQVRQVGAGQEQILQRLDALLAKADTAPLEAWSEAQAGLLTATGRIEKRLDEGFEALFSRVVEQHAELLERFEALLLLTGRIETKVDRVLRLLEDGRYVVEGLPYVPLDQPPEAGEPPFKGLQYFDETDAELFFGREALTADLVGRLRQALTANGQAGGGRFLAVIGASGSGKSSLVRAGLVPALKSGRPLADGSSPPPGSHRWPVHILTPTAHPLEALAASLTRDSVGSHATRTLQAEMAQDPGALALQARKLLSQEGNPGRGRAGRLLLVVDQFEELFTLCADEAERLAFVNALLDAAGLDGSQPGAPRDGPILVVIALRADFYAHCSRYDPLRLALERHQAYIGPMQPEELRRAIEEPARLGSWEFEPGLVDLILRDAGDEPGALPLLSHALYETWIHRRGHTMTLESYAEAGGVRSAIARTAETVFTQRLTPEQRPIARNIFLRLTELGEGTQDTRRRAALTELVSRPEEASAVDAVMKVLSDSRLVTTGQGTAEVAHEALIREWPTLRRWLDEDRQGLRLHRQLTQAAQDWNRLGQDQGALYRGLRLSQVQEWSAAHPDRLSTLERDFLDASQALAEREAAEREAQRRREIEAARRLAEESEARRQAEAARAADAEQAAARLQMRNRVITAVAIATLLIAALAVTFAIAAGYFGVQSNRFASQADQNRKTAQAASTQAIAEADTRATAEADAIQQKATAEAAGQEARLQSQVSLARELAARSISLQERNEDLALLLGIEAVRVAQDLAGSFVPEAQNALFNALQAANFSRVLRGHSEIVWTATFSPDGERILTASLDHTARLWKADGTPLALLDGHSDSVNVAWFSPDGKYLATASSDKTARLWRADGTPVTTLSGHSGIVLWASFSPDSQRILTTSNDQTARLWKFDGTLLATLRGHKDTVTSGSFSPDGSMLLTASLDNTARLWSTDGSELGVLEGHTAWVTSASFSPDGTQILTASWDGSARLWGVDGSLQANLEGHTRSLNSALFSPNGRRILTASWDNTARLWDSQGRPLATLQGHGASVNLAVFSPDGSHIVTASNDNTARLWTAEGRYIATLHGHTDDVMTAFFSPDGKQVITTGWDGTARLWPVEGLYAATLQGHTSGVASALFTPDGSQVLTAGIDGTARLWRLDGTPLAVFEGQQGPVYDASFSPDGRRMVTAHFSNVALIWQADGMLLKTLQGHSDAVSSVRYSPDGERIVTASEDGTARLWSAEGSFLASLEGHQGAVYSAVFSPDGETILTAGEDGTFRLWDLAGKQLASYTGHSVPIWDANFSPDGSLILTSSWDGSARLWQLDGNPVTTLEGHSGLVGSARFNPDGTLIATASQDGTARLWKITGELIAEVEGHSDWVWSAVFSPDGRLLLTASDDSTARLWSVFGDVANMLAEAARRVGRTLTEEECQRYLHLPACH